MKLLVKEAFWHGAFSRS